MQNDRFNKLSLENTNKTRKRMYDPYANEEEYESVDENQSIKEKSKNPFWVPSKNAEVFEVRDILRQEKEKKRLLNRNKRKLKGKSHDYKNKDKERDSFEKSDFNVCENSSKYEQSNLYLTEQRFPEGRKILSRKETKENTDSEYLNTFSNNNSEKNKHDRIPSSQKIQAEAATNGNNGSAIKDLKAQKGSTNMTGIQDLERIRDQKEKEKIDESEKIQSESLNKKIDVLNSRRKDSVRDYINKTREIILTKYTTEIKKERAIRLKETYQNEIESIKDSILSMQHAKQLFEDQFFYKFECYVKYLRLQKEKEKNELNFLLDNKNKIEIEIVKLENKISKQKEKLLQYSEYRDFLICIKERRIRLPDFFVKKTEITFNTSSALGTNNIIASILTNFKNELNSNNSNNVLDIHSNSNKNMSKTRRSSRNIFIANPNATNYSNSNSNNINHNNDNNNNNKNNTIPDIAEVERYNNYLLRPIFESAEELNEEIKKMEFDNINLLEKLDHVRSVSCEQKNELKKIQEEEKKSFEYVSKDIVQREKYFAELKEINQRLKEEKNSLTNERYFLNARAQAGLGADKTLFNLTNKHKNAVGGFSLHKFSSTTIGMSNRANDHSFSFTKHKFNQNMIYSKINTIFNNCLDLKIFKNKNIEKDIKMLDMLKIIEKSIDFLLDRQNVYLFDPEKKPLWDKKKSDLDKERKAKKAQDLKHLDDVKREQLKKSIAERTNKILIIPKKKFGERFRPADNKKSKSQDRNNKNDNSLIDMLYN